MKDFALDESGDILLESGDLSWIRDEPQLCQKIKQVLGTKLGEWRYDPSEGLDFAAFFTKQPEEGRIREAVQSALSEIDDSLVLQDCTYSVVDNCLHLRAICADQEPVELYTIIEEE